MRGVVFADETMTGLGIERARPTIPMMPDDFGGLIAAARHAESFPCSCVTCSLSRWGPTLTLSGKPLSPPVLPGVFAPVASG
jgi:hypothetical protein